MFPHLLVKHIHTHIFHHSASQMHGAYIKVLTHGHLGERAREKNLQLSTHRTTSVAASSHS